MKKNRTFSDLSIRNKVQYIFAIFMALTILLCFLFFVSLSKVKITGTYTEKNADKLNSVHKSYEAVIGNVNNISKLIMVNDSVIKYLRDDMQGTDSSKTIADDTVRSELYRILNPFSGSYYVFVMKQCEVSEVTQYRSDSVPHNPERKELKTFSVSATIGVMTPVDEILFNDRWYFLAKKKKGGYIIVPDGKRAFDSNTDAQVISFRRIVNDMSTQKPIGLLAINIPVNELAETYENFAGDDSVVAYVDNNGTVISSNLSQEEIDVILAENPSLITNDSCHRVKNNIVYDARRITDTDIYLICSSRISFFEDVSAEMLVLVLGMLIIILGIILLISRYINRYVTIPISVLSETMKMSDDEVPVQIEDFNESNDEIGTLHKRYNEMTLKINRLLEKVVEQEKQRQKAEMMVIQEQMKPHFLYNTLDTIGCMALQNTREEVYDAIETLGIFYRKFLSKGSETIPVSDEISIVKNYIKLLRLRYDEMFEDFYEIQEDLNSVMIIKLILQPLVENSIYHGIRPKGEYGIIKISMYTEKDRMHIKVYDSGIGMSSEHIDRLLKGEDRKSFGFKGTIDRIRNFYQNDVFVNIRSDEGEFCEIDISIPYQPQEKNEVI